MKISKIILLLITLTASVFAQFEEGNKDISGVLSTQTISVTIGGEFIANGTYPASRAERLDQFITRIYNIGVTSSVNAFAQRLPLKQIEEMKEYAERGITLKRKDGEDLFIDLKKYRLTGNFDYNPYLNHDDVIIFPAVDLERNFIDISGAVNKPVQFQFVEGDRLSDAILFARGINKAYKDVTTAEISRLDYFGEAEELIEVKISEDPELKRGDRIRIVSEEPQKKVFKALVIGEVYKPGYIYVSYDGTPLTEVIEKAGGFKPEASLKYAELLRNYNSAEMLKKEAWIKNYEGLIDEKGEELTFDKEYRERYENLIMHRLHDLGYEDTLFFNADNRFRIMEDAVTIDFTKLNDENSPESIFKVKDGDVIIVPEKFNYVYVFGQVPNPGYYPFEEGEKFSHYIDLAGGMTEYAKDKDEISVIKGKTRYWIKTAEHEVHMEPGDFIYVPKDPPRNFNYYLTRVGAISSIVGTIATVVLLLTQLGN